MEASVFVDTPHPGVTFIHSRVDLSPICLHYLETYFYSI